jgi:hypothetical protein
MVVGRARSRTIRPSLDVIGRKNYNVAIILGLGMYTQIKEILEGYIHIFWKKGNDFNNV